jgi:hypothetical protein
MAYAGNPSDLAKPAPTTSSGLAESRQRSWKPLLTAIVIVAIIVVVAMATVLTRAKGLSAEDRSYDQIEALRGATSLSVAPGTFAPAARHDEQIEKLQAGVSRMVYQTADPVDHRYDNIENLRANMR